MKRRLQVFISSTFTDLISERQAAVSAILKAGHIPAGMELFTAGDRSQMDTIRRWIDESDVYMLILGGRHGSVEKTSGLSYTELEYDYAREHNKPIFAVVIKDAALEAKVREGGTGFLERENPKVLAAFREKVLGNISSFYEDAKDIRLCVHESLADFAANRDLKGWISADEVTDTKPLVDEIKRLSDENRSLKESLGRLEKKAAAQGAADAKGTEFAELQNVLRAIKIKVPPEAAAGKGFEANLLGLFYNNKDIFVTGVTNRAQASEAESFLYHTACPKLDVYGLVVNEKVSGVQYRRSCATSKGKEFLAFIERSHLLSKSGDGNLEIRDTGERPSESPSSLADTSDGLKGDAVPAAKKPRGRKAVASKSNGADRAKAPPAD